MRLWKIGFEDQDPLSWHDLKYTYPHWLYDVFIYQIYSIGGMTGIYISTIILSCILGILLYVTNIKINKNNLLAFALTIGVMALMKDYIAARAQLVTFILFTLEILFIEYFLDTKKKRYVFRTDDNCRLDCKSTCSSILRIFYIDASIYCGILNSLLKRFFLCT